MCYAHSFNSHYGFEPFKPFYSLPLSTYYKYGVYIYLYTLFSCMDAHSSGILHTSHLIRIVISCHMHIHSVSLLTVVLFLNCNTLVQYCITLRVFTNHNYYRTYAFFSPSHNNYVHNASDYQRVLEPPNLHSRSAISIILINTTFMSCITLLHAFVFNRCEFLNHPYRLNSRVISDV